MRLASAAARVGRDADVVNLTFGALGFAKTPSDGAQARSVEALPPECYDL